MTSDLDTTQVNLHADLAVAPRVLLIDDDELVLEHFQPLIEQAGFVVETCLNAASALQALEQNFAPIIITDRNMPGMDGLELCRQIRRRPWPGYAYILLLTGQDEESEIVAGLDAGADDYLSKRMSTGHLLARLRTAQRILGLEESLRTALSEKDRLSMTDALTGAPNRRYFVKHLTRELKRAQRGGGLLCLMTLDIDHFKHVNDRYGHTGGDAVLQEFVRRVNLCLRRDSDWCARVGGEEFAVVLSDTPLHGAAGVAEHIRHLVAATPMETGKGAVKITVSIGLGTLESFAARDQASLDALLQQSDSNLYLSKHAGRNRVTLPQPGNAAALGATTRPLRSVLYVDDDPDIRQVVEVALGLAPGLQVHVAESGQRGIELARERRPDLILLDVMMPGLDGPGTLTRLRGEPATAEIPVFFMTAKSLPQEIERFRDLGVSGVIAKPFDPMTLAAHVQRLWQQLAPGNV